MRVPIDDHDRAMALMTKLLDVAAEAAQAKWGYSEEQVGSLLASLTISMHTLVIALRQRPELVDPFLDSLETMMIEGEITTKSAHYIRSTSEETIKRWWALVDTWTKDAMEEKWDA